MAIHKVTWFYDGKEHGWTESLWTVATGSHNDTLKFARFLLGRRVQLLGIECRAKAVRVSTEGVGPDALLVYVDFTPRFGLESGGKVRTEPADFPDAAVQIRCQGPLDASHKMIFLRGIWDAVDVNNGVYLPGYKDWADRMGNYLLELKNGWGWIGVTGKSPKVPLVGYTVGANGLVHITFGDPLFPVLPVGTRARIRIAQVNGRSALNGQQLVSITSTTTCTTLTPIGVGPYYFGGYGTYATFGYIPITACEDQKIVERKVGAPLLESRGRQRARPRA